MLVLREMKADGGKGYIFGCAKSKAEAMNNAMGWLMSTRKAFYDMAGYSGRRFVVIRKAR